MKVHPCYFIQISNRYFSESFLSVSSHQCDHLKELKLHLNLQQETLCRQIIDIFATSADSCTLLCPCLFSF